MATAPKSGQASAPPKLIFWWRPWLMGLSCWLLLCLVVPAAQAQTSPKPAGKPKAPKESEAAPLSAKKLEEALQLLLKATTDSAQNQQRRQFRPTEIEGLVMDQTITKVGHDFYDEFFTKWEAPPDIGDFTIVIREKPARGTSTLISVEVNESELLELPLQPKAEAIEEMAAYALEVAGGFLLQARNESKQLERGGRVPLEVF
ncbi:curli production assembly/transport protein CsgE [Hymenobacter sp. HSC-4F20]|uniref:curli production assembly/transport protein CsgE n=1 Tax=Hymenobacter sp. HSC-4F20 TaxID=2864135 RepID=UPI001C72B082|nr:curli production assembly/transport protein CsgE [Hymenobacter sp. HSC-4F20]MBX0288998.1 curli production assembly/transport protein CsgE [Hymenobacter sp. HSC-4F20]